MGKEVRVRVRVRVRERKLDSNTYGNYSSIQNGMSFLHSLESERVILTRCDHSSTNLSWTIPHSLVNRSS